MSFIETFGPRIKQFAAQPLELDPHINILHGSVRSGKTWGLHPKILLATRSNVQGWKVLTGVSKQTIYNNVLSDLFNIIGPRNYHYNSSSGHLELLGSKWMVIGAKDEGSEKYLRGATIGICIGDEITLMPKTFFQMLLTRLSPPGSRFYGSTNPDNPLHWLKSEYLDDQTLKNRKILYDLHVTMDDNPNLTEEFKETQKLLYKGVFYQRYILGLWVMAEGSIYRDSWSDFCMYEDKDRPLSLYNKGGHVDRWVSVDCGVDHPQVYLEWWDDGDVIWCDNEYWWDSREMMRQKTDSQYADDIIEFMGRNKACQILLPPECASFEAELAMRGMWVSQANNEVLEGIQTLSGLMSARKVRFHKQRCARTIRSLLNHCWDAKAAKRGVEQPLKVEDDGADCARYGVHGKIPKWRTLGKEAA
jgi:PBSX family phage terminase large subunit